MNTHKSVGINTEGEEVSPDTMDFYLQETKGWLSLRLADGACAEEFELQLARSSCRLAQDFGGHELLVDFHNVCDEVERLEGKSRFVSGNTKAPTPFKRPPLKGLWHSHWFQAAFLMRNIEQEYLRDNGRAAIKGAEQLIDDMQPDEKITTNTVINAFTYSTVLGGYERRGQRNKNGNFGCLTGEWIVFVKSNDRNIYLTLGAHSEDGNEVKDRCIKAIKQFPELATHPAFLN